MNRLCLLPTLRRAAGALGLCLSLGSPVHAAVQISDNNSEFYMVLYDAAKEASYTLDLGLYFQTLLTDGQSDAGYQRFWTMDPAQDPYLAKLLNLGSPVNSLKWAVFSADQEGFNFVDGDFQGFMTLEHLTPTGTVNPNYLFLTGLDNGAVEVFLNVVGGYGRLVNTDVTNPDSNMNTGGPDNYAFNGSLYAVEGVPGYAADPAFALQEIALGTSVLNTMNTVGRSSWAYMITQKDGFDAFAPAVVDEFDNLEHDAFWGLAEDPDTGILYLSYTLDAVGLTATQRDFALGIGRTEFGGGFSVRRLDGVAVAAGIETPSGFSRALGAAEPLSITTAVPEPGTYALMALGLLAVGAAARRR